MRAWEEERTFAPAIEVDPEIRAVTKREQIVKAFSLERQLRNVDSDFRAGVREIVRIKPARSCE
jgi:hypothetical protein